MHLNVGADFAKVICILIKLILRSAKIVVVVLSCNILLMSDKAARLTPEILTDVISSEIDSTRRE